MLTELFELNKVIKAKQQLPTLRFRSRSPSEVLAVAMERQVIPPRQRVSRCSIGGPCRRASEWENRLIFYMSAEHNSACTHTLRLTSHSYLIQEGESGHRYRSVTSLSPKVLLWWVNALHAYS